MQKAKLSLKRLGRIKPSGRTLSLSNGFTIVELLVVIVVIGILAAITIISYTGISQKATVATLQSDLSNASRRLKLYQAIYGSYPTALDINECPSTPTTDTNYCLKASSNNSYTIYTSDGTTFSLTEANNNGTIYRITDGSSPFSVAVTPITAIDAITGTTQVGLVLTAGALTPSGATVTYQWQNATTSGGTYTNISGATASTYMLTTNDWQKYIKVVATAIGGYTGTQTSIASMVVSDPVNWLVIGTQTWSKANLNVGTMVTGVTIQTNNSILEKYCYSNLESNCTTYGAFYQWDEAMQYVTTEGAQGICPASSHIPSDNDWKILEMQLGMSQVQADATGWRGTDQGTQLKSGGTSNMNIIFTGRRSPAGAFNFLSTDAYFWSSSESSINAWNRYLNSGLASVYRNLYDKGNGYSVRCLAN